MNISAFHRLNIPKQYKSLSLSVEGRDKVFNSCVLDLKLMMGCMNNKPELNHTEFLSLNDNLCSHLF